MRLCLAGATNAPWPFRVRRRTLWHARVVIGLVGAIVVGRLTVQLLLFMAIFVGRSWWRYRDVPLQSVPVPRTEWDHQQVVRVGALPDSDDADEAIRQHLGHRRRERAREERLLPWLCWPMAGIAALVAVVATRPGYLLVAAAWVGLERAYRHSGAGERARLDLLEADLDHRHPTGFAHG